MLQNSTRSQWEEAFPLAKRAAKEAKQFDVKVFLNFLKKHKLFGESLRQELHDIYELLVDAMKLAEAVRSKPEHSNELNSLTENMDNIHRKSSDVIVKLQAGKNMLVNSTVRLKYFGNIEIRLTELVKRYVKENPDTKLSKSDAFALAGHMQQVVKDMLPLFQSISIAYEHDSIEIDSLLNTEINKVQTALTSKDVKQIDFNPLLTHIKHVEKELDNLLDAAEKINKLSRLNEKYAKAMEALIHEMLETQTEELAEADKQRNLRLLGRKN